ncbi:MAG TPA: hypothetical protein VGF99_21265 [Myxococcota bacterium]
MLVMVLLSSLAAGAPLTSTCAPPSSTTALIAPAADAVAVPVNAVVVVDGRAATLDGVTLGGPTGTIATTVRTRAIVDAFGAGEIGFLTPTTSLPAGAVITVAAADGVLGTFTVGDRADTEAPVLPLVDDLGQGGTDCAPLNRLEVTAGVPDVTAGWAIATVAGTDDDDPIAGIVGVTGGRAGIVTLTGTPERPVAVAIVVSDLAGHESPPRTIEVVFGQGASYRAIGCFGCSSSSALPLPLLGIGLLLGRRRRGVTVRVDRHRSPMRTPIACFVVVVGCFIGCGPRPFAGTGENVRCEGDRCICEAQDFACDATCGVGECPALECRNGEACSLSCEAGCDHRCHDVNVCTTDCGADCDLDCRNIADCTTSCGADCTQRCTDLSNCNVDVGPGSVVVCDRVGNCSVDCDGDCRVTCRNTGTCNVNCDDGAATVCDDGVTRVCGQSC